MKIRYSLICYIIVIVLMPTLTNAAIFNGSQTNNIQSMIGKTITIAPQANILTGGFCPSDSSVYYIKSTSRIFFSDSPVMATVQNIDFCNDGLVLELFDKTLGGGKVRFVINGPVKNNFAETIKTAMNPDKVILNKKSKTVHLCNCNHLPEPTDREEMSLNEAIMNNFNLCGLCFSKFTYLPESWIERKIANKATSSLDIWRSMTVDKSLQEHVRSVGEKVLKTWPVKTVGYNYSFLVSDGIYPNAYALPDGEIILNKSLVNSLESEDELVAVITHEIAHVERRHALREIKLTLEKLQDGVILDDMTNVFAVATAGTNNQGASIADAYALLDSVIGIIVTNIYYDKYPQEYEREADELAYLYFKANNLNMADLQNVFRKFEFYNLTTMSQIDPSSESRPYLDERIYQSEPFRCNMFPPNKLVCKQNNAILNLQYQAIYKDKCILALYIDDYDMIKALIRSYDYNSLVLTLYDNKDRAFKYSSNRDKIIRDTWGSFIVFENSKPEYMENIKRIEIEYITNEHVQNSSPTIGKSLQSSYFFRDLSDRN